MSSKAELLPLVPESEIDLLDSSNSVRYDLKTNPADADSPTYHKKVRILNGYESIPYNNTINEDLYCYDEPELNTLDDVLNSKYNENDEVFSIAKFVRGQPQKKKQKTSDLRPVTFIRFNTRRGKVKPVTLRALLDSGGSGCLINEKFTKKLKLREISSKAKWNTPAGTLTTKGKVRAQFTLPELHDNRVVEWEFHVTNNLVNYDMIIGRDMLEDLGIDIQFSDQTIVWDGHDMPFKDMTKDMDIADAFHVEEPEMVQEMTDRLSKIIDNDYKKASLQEVVDGHNHLTKDEKQQLFTLLERHEHLFDGSLGQWTHPDYHLELKPDVKPYHAKAFPVPRVHMETLKKEVERLCDVGVLKRVNRSEWAAPTFIIPKKDGKVRFVSDFRELNTRIKRMHYPVPNIQEIMLNPEGFQYANALDLKMGYYSVELDPDSRQPFVIHTDATDSHLGAVISKNDEPIAFNNRRLNPPQQRYTTTEKELLSIVETLKEFRMILLGHHIIVHTDNKNLLCKTFNTNRVMRWRLIIEEFRAQLLHQWPRPR